MTGTSIWKTLLSDGTVLIAGGLNNDGPDTGLFGFACDYCDMQAFALDAAKLFAPANGTSSIIGSLREPRSAHRAVLLSDGKTVLVIGGADDNTMEIYH